MEPLLQSLRRYIMGENTFDETDFKEVLEVSFYWSFMNVKSETNFSVGRLICYPKHETITDRLAFSGGRKPLTDCHTSTRDHFCGIRKT